jgi:hypothetical protein
LQPVCNDLDERRLLRSEVVELLRLGRQELLQLRLRHQVLLQLSRAATLERRGPAKLAGPFRFSSP